jgi:hypothetical protein
MLRILCVFIVILACIGGFFLRRNDKFMKNDRKISLTLDHLTVE